jgi:hypothetical protein
VYSQEPVHCDDECDVISGQAHRCQHNDHGDQACLWNPSCPNTRSRGCDAVKRNPKRENIFTIPPSGEQNTFALTPDLLLERHTSEKWKSLKNIQSYYLSCAYLVSSDILSMVDLI